MPEFPSVLIVTGASAAGKSTVAQGLAERLPRAVHLRGDLFRRMVVTGRAEPGEGPEAAWMGQLKLRYALAARVAEGYAEAGFTVIYQDILNRFLGDALAALRRWSPGAVVLCPSADVLTGREADRPKTAYRGSWTPQDMDALLHAETPRVGLWLDTSQMSAAETVDFILAHPERTREGLPLMLLSSDIWVYALIRRAEQGGAFAMVLRKGDARGGAVLVKVLNRKAGETRLYARATRFDGEEVWMEPIGSTVESELDAYVERQARIDPDIWVVEIEDGQGRHFITERVESR